MSVMQIREEVQAAETVWSDVPKNDNKKKREEFHFNYDVKHALRRAGYRVKNDKKSKEGTNNESSN